MNKEGKDVKIVRMAILMPLDIREWFNEHPEYNMSEFIRIAIREKIQKIEGKVNK
ncbi:MAG: hypothetical protein QXP59_04750 [Saccharolobus sp.]